MIVTMIFKIYEYRKIISKLILLKEEKNLGIKILNKFSYHYFIAIIILLGKLMPTNLRQLIINHYEEVVLHWKIAKKFSTDKNSFKISLNKI